MVDGLGCEQGHARAQAAAHGHRRCETHFVQAVVDAHARLLDLERRLKKSGQHGQREESVGDRRPKRPRLRTLRVDMDPLVVPRGFGKTVDPLLGDFNPVAHGHFLARTGGHFGQRLKYFHRARL